MGETLDNRTGNLAYIDVCKAIGIILVIVGHGYGLPEVLHNMLYSFHMPFFFIISGFLYNNSKYKSMSFGKVVLKRFKSYMIPYFGFGIADLILHFGWDLAINKHLHSINDIAEHLYGILICNTDYMPDCGPIWFLFCLFVSSVAFWFIMKLSLKLAGIVSALCMLASYCIFLFVDFKLPFSISASLMAVFFMYVGYLMRKYDVFALMNKKKISNLILFVCFAVGVIAGYFNGYVSMNATQYGILPLYLCSSIFISVALMFVCYKATFFENRFTLWLGKNTIFVIGFNQIINTVCIEAYYLTPIVRNIPLNAYILLIYSFTGCIVGILFYNFIRKLFWKMIRGKTT